MLDETQQSHTGQSGASATGGATSSSESSTGGTTGGSTTGTTGTTGTNTRAAQTLIDDLTVLGTKFAEVVEVAWNSEQRRQIEDDLRKGLVTVAESLEDGLKRVGESKEAKEFVNAAEDVAGKVRSSKVAGELASALSQGLRALSEQMDRLAEDLRTRGSSTGTSSSGGTSHQSSTSADPTRPQEELPQDIPINKIHDL
jgi:hypothetical protein